MPYFSFKEKGKSRADRIAICTVLIALLLSASPFPVLAGETDIAGFVENATFYRDDRGLSKFRNTAQLEIAKDLEDAFNASTMSLNATFRATYDGVYDLNDDEWGKNAGGPIMLQNGDGTFGPLFVPHGGGLSFLRNGVPTGLPPTLGFPPSTDFSQFPFPPFFGNPESRSL